MYSSRTRLTPCGQPSRDCHNLKSLRAPQKAKICMIKQLEDGLQGCIRSLHQVVVKEVLSSPRSWTTYAQRLLVCHNVIFARAPADVKEMYNQTALR
jgi:hypothetical protein